ncbi:MAG: 1-deoxy-D-xylulose-5-phosphate reductoisomerase, partial [Planctomycetota bacterium]
NGINIALANKETLVAAGSIVTEACARTGSRLLPVDSEHSALWQCLESRSRNATAGALRPPFNAPSDITKLTLTASGGALRTFPLDQLQEATPDQALAHPNWDMGAKVTIDSASLTNKALELIEAKWLFGVSSDRLDAIIHPSSIVHSFVEFADGSVLAQLGAPDMRTPIQHAITHPVRTIGISDKLDLRRLAELQFEPVDERRFPAIRTGYRVIDEGGTSGAIFNAANEVAVQAFLERRVPFGRIAEIGASAIDAIGISPVHSLDDIENADTEARRYAESAITNATV